MNEPRTAGEDLESILERLIFENPDPRIQRLKGIWEDAKREAKELLDAACEENYQTRLEYHRTCRELPPEVLARADASVLRQLCMEEYDERLATIWRDITARVSRVLEDVAGSGDGD